MMEAIYMTSTQSENHLVFIVRTAFYTGTANGNLLDFLVEKIFFKKI